MDSSSPKLKKQTIEMSVSHQKKKISKMNLPQKNFLDFLNKSPSLPRKKKWYQKLIRIGSKIENCNIKKANQNKVLPFSSHMKRQNLLNYHENMPYDLRDKKGKNYLSIVCLVKKFIQIIKTATFLKKIIGLRSYHFHVIGDTSNFYKKGSEFGESFFSNLANKNSQDYDNEAENLRRKKYLKVFKSKNIILFDDFLSYFKNITRKIPTLRPDNWLKLIWDAFLLFFILLNTLIVPLNLCFGLELLSVNNIWFDIIELIMLYLITLDMFLSIFTAYYSEGVIITNKIRILKNYFSNSFLWDFLSITPYFLSPYFENQYMKLFLMLSLIKMKKIFIGLEEHLFLSTKVKGIYELFKLLVLIIYVGHFFACFWIYIAKVEIELGAWNTWIQTFNLIHEKWYYQYISSLYFAVYTMVTVGYGDIYPTNILERTLSILLMLLACGVFAYSLNRFGTIVEEMYQYETQFKAQIHDFTHYMKIRNVENNLQMKIKRYMEYLHEERTSGFNRGEILLNYLSPRLKNELIENIYTKWIFNIPLLKNNFSESFLKKLALKFEEKTYSPEDIIYEKGDIENLGLYYIVKGEVFNFLENQSKKLQNFPIGKSFGEFSFFSDHAREISVKSDQVTHVAFISRKEFLSVLSNYEEDYEKFIVMKEKINLYGIKSLLEIQCDSCNRKDHFISKCPFVNADFQMEKVLSNYRTECFNERKKFKRKQKKKHNAKKNIKFIQEKSKSFEISAVNYYDSSINIDDSLENIDEESIENMESYNNYDKFCKEINDKENNNKECKTIMKNSKSLASKKKSLLSKNSIPEEMIKSKMSEVSPTGSSNKKVFFVESFLVEHEEEKQLSENNTLAKQPSLKCRKILNIQTFNIFSNISQSKRFIVTSDEKGFEISPKASLSRSKFDGNKTQNLKTSIEETEWPNEKAMNQKLEEKAEVILNSLNNKESASFLEFDKAKIYKFYFSHNNIDRILIAINSKIIDKNNKKRYNSHFIKTSCRKRKVLHLT